MKEISWTSPTYGEFKIQLDNEDYERFIGKLTIAHVRPRLNTIFRPQVRLRPRIDQRPDALARVLMQPGTGLVVDHIDGNPLNNQKSNLRVCTPQENCRNSAKRLNAKYKYKGIVQVKGKWNCTINFGHFDTPEEAAQKYDAIASLVYGEFARLNFPLKE